MAAMGQKWVEMKTDRVETGWFYAAPAAENSPDQRKNKQSRHEKMIKYGIFGLVID